MRIRRVVVRVEGPAVTPARARALAERALASTAAEVAARGTWAAGTRIGPLRVRIAASSVDDPALVGRIGRAVTAAIAGRSRW